MGLRGGLMELTCQTPWPEVIVDQIPNRLAQETAMPASALTQAQGVSIIRANDFEHLLYACVVSVT